MPTRARDKSVLTVREAASMLNVHVNTVRRWSDLGLLKAFRLGPRGDRRFSHDDVAGLLKRQR